MFFKLNNVFTSSVAPLTSKSPPSKFNCFIALWSRVDVSIADITAASKPAPTAPEMAPTAPEFFSNKLEILFESGFPNPKVPAYAVEILTIDFLILLAKFASSGLAASSIFLGNGPLIFKFCNAK